MEYSGPRFSLLTFGLGWCWLCKGQVKSASTSITKILSELQNFWSIFKVIRNFDQDNCNHVLLSSITFACMFLPLGLRVAIDKPLGWTIQQAFQEQLRLLTSERRWRSPMRPHVVRSEVSLVVQMCIFCDSNQSQFCVSLLISLPVFIWFGSCRVFPWYKVHRRSSLNDRFMHPNGQLPAYEWNFNDVNPPVHAGLPKHVLFVCFCGTFWFHPCKRLPGGRFTGLGSLASFPNGPQEPWWCGRPVHAPHGKTVSQNTGLYLLRLLIPWSQASWKSCSTKWCWGLQFTLQFKKKFTAVSCCCCCTTFV